MANHQLAPMDVAFELIEPARESFLALLSGQTQDQREATFRREAGFACQVLGDRKNDYALKIARENPHSVISAVVNVAAIGISLNPATKQAYLVPRDGKICLDISYRGLVDLGTNSGAIRWAKAHMVYASDTFRLHGYDKAPTHEYDPFAKDRGDALGVYVVAKTADGDFITHTMAIDDVFDIRDRSSAWKAWIDPTKKKSCPWVTDEVEMVKKTCIKQASKSWPRDATDSPLDKAIHYLNTDGGEGLELDAQPAPQAALPEVKMPVRKGSPTDVTPQAPVNQAQTAPVKPTEVQQPATNDRPATDGEKSHIRVKAGERLRELLERCGIPSLDQITSAQFAKLRSGLKEFV